MNRATRLYIEAVELDDPARVPDPADPILHEHYRADRSQWPLPWCQAAYGCGKADGHDGDCWGVRDMDWGPQ